MALSKNPKMSFFCSNFLSLTSHRTQMNYRCQNFAVICQPVGGRGAAYKAVMRASSFRPVLEPFRSDRNGVMMQRRREGGSAGQVKG